MQNQIIEKLRCELSLPIQTERQVVYILVEIRKFLEQIDEGNSFSTLKFYCSWAAHFKMSYRDARAFIAAVDCYLCKAFCAGIKQEENDTFCELLYLDAFKKQLRAFLNSVGLLDSICDGKGWSNFLKLYSQVIEDCPLICESSEVSLKMVDRMVFTKIEETASATESNSDGSFSFAMRWELSYRGEPIGELNLSPNGRLVGSTLKLNPNAKTG